MKSKTVFLTTVLAVGAANVSLESALAGDSGRDVTINVIGEDNTASFQTGIASGAEISGITIINGEVWIDGQKVPRGAKSFTAKSGKSYLIESGPNGVVVRDK